MPTELRTLADLPGYIAERFPRDVLVQRCLPDRIDDFSTRRFCDQIDRVAASLHASGVAKGDRVVLIAESRPEWLIADLAILSIGAVTTPIYPTLSASQAQYILTDSDARFAIVSNAAQLTKVQSARSVLPRLLDAAVMDGHDAPGALTLEALADRGAVLLSAGPEAMARLRAARAAVNPEDLATLIYTSGTTGEPKGVMLTHDNILSNALAAQQIIPATESDVALSFLPLSHAFERTACVWYLLTGLTIAFAGSVDSMTRDLARIRPTLMTAVPRVFEKVHARIMEVGQSGSVVRRRVFTWAMDANRAWAQARLARRPVSTTLALRHAAADVLVFSKIREQLGGRIRYFFSGSAPLSPALGEFFYGLGLPIVEGYGLTETSPILSASPVNALRYGAVGKPIAGVEVKIAGDGEILARGRNIMRGYWNKPQATAEALVDGWFHTGDVGHLDEMGYLVITDRKKELIVTSGGKKIAPQLVERLVKASPLIAECVLIGEGRRFPSMLIVPDFRALAAHVGVRLDSADQNKGLVERPEAVAAIDAFMASVNGSLAQFERVKKFVLLDREFTIDAGELTPTLKVRRKIIEQRYADRIRSMYEGDAPG